MNLCLILTLDWMTVCISCTQIAGTLKQTEQGYFEGGPGYGCTSPARAISSRSGVESGSVFSSSVG